MSRPVKSRQLQVTEAIPASKASAKKRLKSSYRYGEAYITQDFARAIQKERKTLIQSMFAAKQAGHDAKVDNRSLFINNNVFNISNISTEYQVAPS